jgi:hypothetical protein
VHVPHDAKTLKAAGLITGVVVILVCVAAVLGYRAGQAPVTSAPAETSVPGGAVPITDLAGFVQAITGNWQTADEQLLIQNDKGVMEFVRQTKLETGEIRLDQYVGAPVRLEAAQRWLELETPDGLWLLRLIPGGRRAQLSVTYPDQSQVVYE